MIRRNESGFTLVEVMIALSILLVILGIAYASYVAATGSAGAFQARIDVERRAHVTLGLMERELRCGWLEPEQAKTTAAGSESIRREVPPQFLLRRPAVDEGFLRLLTTSTMSSPDLPCGGIRQVEWRFDEENGTLLRRQSPRSMANDAPADSPWLCVAGGVKSVECTVYDGKQWVDAWNSNDKRALPRLAGVKLVFMGDEGSELAFEMRTYVSCGGEQRPAGASDGNLAPGGT